MGSSTPATTTQNQNSVSTSSPYAPAQGLIDSLISKYSGAPTSPSAAQTNAAQAGVDATTGLPNFTPQATSAVNSTFGNAGILNNAYGTLQNNLGATASGANLNPYTTPGFGDALNTMTSDITNATKGVYAASGRDPSGAGSFSQSLGRGLTQGLAPVIQSQYNTNEQNMLGANNTLYNAGNSTVGALNANTGAALAGATALPGVATANSSAALNAANTQQSLPYADLLQQLQAAGILGGMGGTTTSVGSATGTQTPANNPLANWIGGISAGAGLLGAFSDERLKDDVRPVGKLNDGQVVYSYRMKGSKTPQIGLLADEVQQHVPEAVGERSGFKTVNYATATDRAHKIGMLAA
jgi:hypothetical protein